MPKTLQAVAPAATEIEGRGGSVPTIPLLTVHRAVKEISLRARASLDPIQISEKRRADEIRPA